MREVFRYLGYGTHAPDTDMEALARECLQEITRADNPRQTHLFLPMTMQGQTVQIGSLTIESGNLSRNLQGCTQAVLFAATLGTGCDRLIARYTKRMQMSRATVIQAAAAAYIEAYCDELQKKIGQEAERQGLFMRPRFSPGYGDFSLDYQTHIIQMLDTPRRIGLTLTAGLALAPSKSVTAVIGLSPHNERCHISGCETCNKTNCAYRRS